MHLRRAQHGSSQRFAGSRSVYGLVAGTDTVPAFKALSLCFFIFWEVQALDISELLTDHTQWEDFIYNKRESGHLYPREDEALSE